MARTELASARLTPEEKELLAALASIMERSESDVLRRLIREAAAAQNIVLRFATHISDQEQAAQNSC